jgi:PAS domain S-box-containing protein
MNKVSLRTALPYVGVGGGFILLDLIMDRLVSGTPVFNLSHFILIVLVVLISLTLLARAMEAHGRAEAVLRRARDEMEVRVRERTAELERANDALQTEVTERTHIGEVLRASEEKYRLLFQNMAEGFALYELLYDKAGKPVDWLVLEVNDAYVRHTGVASERIVGRRISELFPAAIPEYLPRFAQVVATQTASEFDTYAEAVDRYQHVVTFPAGGHRFASVIQDITDRKRAEEALRQSEERFRLALKNAPVTVAVQDKDLRFIWAYNQRTVRPADVIGKTDTDLFPPDYAARLLTLKRQVLETGTEIKDQLWVVSGNQRVYLDLYLEPIRNAIGEIEGVGIATVDLTERKHAEDALRASEEKFATVFHLSPDAIGVMRAADGSLLDVNEAFTELLGYSRSEVIGRTWTDLHLASAADKPDQVAELLLERGVVAEHELHLATKEGNIATVLLSLTPITVSEELCVLAIAHDITRRKRLEEAWRGTQAELALAMQERIRLEERQRLARELHDSVAQALYGISLGTHTALAVLDTNRIAVREALNYVLSLTQGGLTEMRALIFELRPESLQVEGLAIALTRQTAALRAIHGIEVDLSLCDEPDVPLEIKEALYRIAQEAMQNAIKYARLSRLEVRLTCQPGSLALEVCDNGKGFDPLAAYPGHLGLHSMRERAESMGGTLEIASAPGCGTQVRACLPVPAPPPAPPAGGPPADYSA